MKKLMIAAALACSAAVTQAASVVWGGAVAVPGYPDSPLKAGTHAALLYSGVAFTAAATSLSKWAVDATSDNGGSIVATYDLTSADAYNQTFSASYGVDGSADGYYAVLVLNDEGTLASYYDVGSVTGTSGASAATDLKVNMDWGGPEYLTSGGYTVSVPEPTSGLLLLFGMAGLALKRKRA